MISSQPRFTEKTSSESGSHPARQNREISKRSVVKILHLITGLDSGGTEEMLYQMVRRLDTGRYRNIVCSLKPGGRMSSKLADEGIPVLSVGMSRSHPVRALPRLAKLLRAERPDILHAHLFHASIIGRAAGRLFGVPVVISTQRSTDDDWRRRRHVLADRLTARWTDVILSNSQAGMDRLLNIEKIPSKKLRVIHNGIDAERFTTEATSQKEVVVGTMARLHPVKNLGLLLEALAILRENDGRVTGLIAGEGELEQELRDHAHRLNLSNSLVFAGFRSDIPEVLRGIDIFVLTSDCEGLPTAVLEAMAAGKPIVATAVGGVPELVIDGKNGFVVPPGDLSTFASRLRELVRSPDLRLKMGAQGRALVLKRFTLDRMVARTQSLYEELLAAKSSDLGRT